MSEPHSSAARVLVIAPTAETRRELSEALEAFRFEVMSMRPPHRLDEAVDGAGYAAMVMQVEGALGRDWLGTLSRIRDSAERFPVILIMERIDARTLIEVLAAGACDFLVRPFKPEELCVRVATLVRNRGRAAADRLEFNGVLLDRRSYAVHVDGVEVRLTPKEFRILEVVMLRPNAVVTRRELLRSVWGMEFNPGTNVVDVHIANLRRKLRDADARVSLQTVWGVGFRLVPSADEAPRRQAN